MSVRTEQDNLHVNALVVDEDTLRYGGSLFLRSRDEPCSVVEAWDGKGGRPMLCMCDARDKRSI